MRKPTYIYIEWESVPTYKLFLACNARSISIPSNSVVAPILDKFRLWNERLSNNVVLYWLASLLDLNPKNFQSAVNDARLISHLPPLNYV